MATRFLPFARSVVTTKQALASFLSRSTVSSTSLSVSELSLIRLRQLAAVTYVFGGVSPTSLGGFRTFSNWLNRPPKSAILLDGCDMEHWLVVMEKPDDNMTRDDIIDMYIKTLAQVVGSEEEARMKIYSVSTRHYFAFGALVSEELLDKLRELPKVRWVLPDSYLDIKNKDYGGEPFINGQAVPYDPKYHEEWLRGNATTMERNRRNDRPHDFDRSRNFERTQNVQNQGPPMQGQMPNHSIGGPSQHVMGGQIVGNVGGSTPNTGGMPPNNMGGTLNMGGVDSLGE